MLMSLTSAIIRAGIIFQIMQPILKHILILIFNNKLIPIFISTQYIRESAALQLQNFPLLVIILLQKLEYPSHMPWRVAPIQKR